MKKNSPMPQRKRFSAKQALVYFCAQLLGAFIGAVLCWVAFRDHFDAEEDPGKKLGVFSTGPAIRYAINPARDLGPRIAHFVLPIRGKGSSDWGYSWIPVVAPLVGAVLATLLFKSTDAADLIKAVKPS